MPLPAAFRPDRPHDFADGSDLFGHRDYAHVLAAAVLETEADFTFGLFGDWGLGKTTVLRQLQSELRDNTVCAAVMFDAWRYQDDPFRREFLREVSKQLAEQRALRGWKPKDELGILDTDVAVTRDGGLQLSWPAALSAIVVVALLAAVLVAVVGGRVFVTSASAPLTLVVLMPVLTFVLLQVRGVFKAQQQMVTRRRLEDPDRFASVFRSLVGHVGVPTTSLRNPTVRPYGRGPG